MNQENIESLKNSVFISLWLWFKCMYCVWCVKWFGEDHHE